MEYEDDLDTEIKTSDKTLNSNAGGMLKNQNKQEILSSSGNNNRVPGNNQNISHGSAVSNQSLMSVFPQNQPVGVQNPVNLQNKPAQGGFPGTTVNNKSSDLNKSTHSSSSQSSGPIHPNSFGGNMSQFMNSNPKGQNFNAPLPQNKEPLSKFPYNSTASNILNEGLSPTNIMSNVPVINFSNSGQKIDSANQFSNPINPLQNNPNFQPKQLNPHNIFQPGPESSENKFQHISNPSILLNNPASTNSKAPFADNFSSPQPNPLNPHDRMQKPNFNNPINVPNSSVNLPNIPGNPLNSSIPNFNQPISAAQNLIKDEAQNNASFAKIGPSVLKNDFKSSQVDFQTVQIIHQNKPPGSGTSINQASQNFKPLGEIIASPNQSSKISSDNKANQPLPSYFPEAKNLNPGQIGKQIVPAQKHNNRVSYIEKSATDTPIKLNKEIPKNPINIKVVKMVPEDTIRSQITLINILSNLIDYNQLIHNYSDFSKYLSTNSSKGSGECEKLLKFIDERLSCELCNENNMNSLIELKCKSLICTNCLLNAGEISIKKNFFECPKCRKIIDEDEQILIWQKLGKSSKQVEREKLELKYKNEGQLICAKCEKYKKNFYPCCLHVCKECLAADFRKNLVSCSQCYENFNFDEILNETFECKSCEQITYFVGSYGKYVHNESQLLCINCVFSFFNQGYDRVLKIKLSKLERIEINDHLFQRCEGCNTEIFKEYMVIEKCGHEMCQNCQGNKVCNSCIRLVIS